ncbi:MAG: hypothetical protein K2P64_04820 [Lachnospiraceae bacterium]|nr:hypothetical protein [Lachnospiraceae bacterium]
MQYDVSRIHEDYHFNITGVSYIGRPQSNTAMYINKKISDQLTKLESAEQCLVFAENSIEIPNSLKKNHAILLVKNPQLEYAKLAAELESIQAEEDKKYQYIYSNGSYISETAVIGKDSHIEQGCIVGHHVVIGENAVLLNGTVIKNSTIGDRFVANEYAVVGANGYTIAENESGNKIRIPSLGRVTIGNNVEIGVHDNVSRGSAGNTILEDYVKLDAFVHIGHDAHLLRNVEVTAGAIVGGYDVVGEKTFIGLNATLRNRIEIGDKVLLGMGAVVTKSVERDMIVAGNPARSFSTVSGGVKQKRYMRLLKEAV